MSTISFGSTALSNGSGIDVQSIVNQLLFVERAPARSWETQRTLLNSQASAARDINSKLLDLQSKLNALKDLAGKFNSHTAASSDPTTVSASADPTAASASHSITISSLAATSSYYSAQLADSSTIFATGSFDISIGGSAPTTITVDSTHNTLDGLAAAVNDLNIGVRASIITDANGSRLSLVSSSSGAAGDLAISNNSTGLSFTKAATGKNAELTVDGVPVSSATNSVNTAVAGVTFNLLSISVSAVSVTVQPDTSKAREAATDFVTSFNAVVQSINAQFSANPSSGQVPPLFADGSLRLVQDQILASATYSIAGNNGITTLGAIGISMQNDGTLSVDGARLDNALSSSYAEIQNLFQSQSPAGFARNFSTQLTTLTDSLSGTLNLALKGIAENQAALTNQISDFDTRLEARRQQLSDQYSRIDAQLRQLPLIQAQIQAQLGSLR
jgi:flagellar hook-associated protein 2